MTGTSEEFSKQRDAAYDRILTHVQKHIDAITVPVTASLVTIAPSDARDAAEKDVWTLFKNGIQHLKDGGHLGQPGHFSDAVTKTSLRSASMAAALGVKPPKFEENYFETNFATGEAEAVWYSRRLLEAALADAEKSKMLIYGHLGFKTPLAAPDKAKVNDPELAGVFGAAQAAAAPKAGDDLIAGLRRQAILSFRMISDLYNPATEKLKQEIADIFKTPSPKPASKGPSFDM